MNRKERPLLDLNQRSGERFLANHDTTNVVQSVTWREGCDDRFH